MQLLSVSYDLKYFMINIRDQRGDCLPDDSIFSNEKRCYLVIVNHPQNRNLFHCFETPLELKHSNKILAYIVLCRFLPATLTNFNLFYDFLFHFLQSTSHQNVIFRTLLTATVCWSSSLEKLVFKYLHASSKFTKSLPKINLLFSYAL